VEIRHRQQVGLARLEPFGPRQGLALRTVPIPAAVIRDAGMAARIAGVDVAAQGLGAADLEGAQDPQLGAVQRAGASPKAGPARLRTIARKLILRLRDLAREVGGLVDAARTLVFRHLRIGTQRTRAIYFTVGAMGSDDFLGSLALFHPLV